jgi:hypothetical protein
MRGAPPAAIAGVGRWRSARPDRGPPSPVVSRSRVFPYLPVGQIYTPNCNNVRTRKISPTATPGEYGVDEDPGDGGHGLRMVRQQGAQLESHREAGPVPVAEPV